MNRSCIPPEDLGRVLTLPGDAPECRHVEACPRCRASLLSYREFVEDRFVPAGADPPEAGAHLRTAFREALRTRESETDGVGAHVGSLTSSFTARAREIIRLLGRPLVLIPTAAAILLAIGLQAGYERFRFGRGPDQLRGVDSSEEAGIATIALLEPRATGDGGVELTWRSDPGITSYELVIMGDDLTDLVRLSALRDTVCVVRWAELRTAPRPGAVLGWQVFGRRNGALGARSPIRTLLVP